MSKLIILTLLFFTLVSYSQNLDLAISYLAGERSKDSHTTEESFVLSGTNAAYSVKYSGHRGPNQKDDSKTCDLTSKNIEEIKNFITEKGLDKSDSLIDESTKYKSFETFANISAAISLDGKEYKIKVNGDTDEIGGKDLYKNMVKLIDKLRVMVIECK